MTSIGFIGPGIMGGPMIANLVKAGHTVRALGRSEASWSRVDAAGAQRATDLKDATSECEVVITMLPDAPDVRAVVFGGADVGVSDETMETPEQHAPGLVDLLHEGQVFIDMSTIAPAASREVADALRAKGVAALDAPVSGGESGAVAGTLSIMVGGALDTLDRIRPVLEAVGSTITHVGPNGAGQLTKAGNQLVVAANIQAVAEAIVLLESSDVDLPAAIHAISGGLAGSTVLDRKGDALLASDYSPGFRVALHDKDLGIVLSTMDDQGLALPLTAVVAQLMRSARRRGMGHLDHGALLQLARDLNGTGR